MYVGTQQNTASSVSYVISLSNNGEENQEQRQGVEFSLEQSTDWCVTCMLNQSKAHKIKLPHMYLFTIYHL